MEISGFRNLADNLVNHENIAVDFVKEMESSFDEVLSYNFEQACVYDDRPLKQLRTSSDMPTTTFQFDVIPTCDRKHVLMKPTNEAFVASKAIAFRSHSSSAHQHHSKLADHCLAERKRREKLSQRFVALSALLPAGLIKKMDKASILEDAIEYMKRLEEKVKGLEAKARKRSMVFTINKDDDGDLPLIRARFSDKELLISIDCERGRGGVLEKIVGEIENLQFSVVNSSLMTYGDSSLSITLIAEKSDEEDNINIEQLVRNLRGLLKIHLSN